MRVIRELLLLALVGGCGRVAFDQRDARSDGVAPRGCITQLAAYGDSMCILRSDGHVWCWGDGSVGQMGDGTLASRLVPGPTNLTDAIAITSGEDTICAIRANHTLVCWGEGAMGQIGDGAGMSRSVPSLVALPAEPVEIDAGQYHACARLADGTGRCWGRNANGALGQPASGIQLSPVVSPALGAARQVAIGDNVTCIVQGDNSVACWGIDQLGELGDGGSTDRSTAQPIAVVADPVVQVVGGCHRHLCAVTAPGDVYCWGANDYAQVGTGSTSMAERLPVRVANIPAASRVAIGASHSCALARDGSIWCWGDNTSGQLGDGTFTASPAPRQVAAFRGTVADLQGSCGGMLALRDDGTLFGWGAATQLGTGQMTDQPTPVDVDVPCP